MRRIVSPRELQRFADRLETVELRHNHHGAGCALLVRGPIRSDGSQEVRRMGNRPDTGLPPFSVHIDPPEVVLDRLTRRELRKMLPGGREPTPEQLEKARSEAAEQMRIGMAKAQADG
jgi:hypothetical protein